VTFDFQEVNKAILSQVWNDRDYVLLVAQVLYLTSIIGPDGLDYAGSTTAVTGDCSECGTWCVELSPFDLSMTFPDGTGYFTEAGEAHTEERYGWEMYGTVVVDTTDCVITRVGASQNRQGGLGNNQLSVSASPVSTTMALTVYSDYNAMWVTEDDITKYSTSDETTIEVYIYCGSDRNISCDKVRIVGTGRNPFGLGSNC
jgi:hypothetical protein